MDLKSPRGRYLLYLSGFGCLTLLTLLLRSLALTLSFDVEIGYFSKGTALPIVVHVFEVISLLVCFVPFFLFGKQAKLSVKHAPLNLAERIAAGLAALGLLGVVAYLILCLSGDATLIPAPKVLAILCALFSLIGVFFFLQLIRDRKEPAALFGSGVILAAVLLLSITYFDRYTQMNTPHKVSLHLCMLSIMLCMLFEIRTLIGQERPLGHAVASCLCIFCTATYGGSNLIAFLAGSYSDPLYLMGDLLSLGFAIYLICRTVCGLLRNKSESTPAPTETEENQ